MKSTKAAASNAMIRKPTLRRSENVPFPDDWGLAGAGPQPLQIIVLKSHPTIYVQRLNNLMETQALENMPKILFAHNVIRCG